MRKRQRVGAYSVLTGPGIKPRRVPLGGLPASSRRDLDRYASGGTCVARPLVVKRSSLKLAWECLEKGRRIDLFAWHASGTRLTDRTQGYG